MEAEFDYIKAMRARKSVRTYKADRPVSAIHENSISRFIADVTNPFGINGIEINYINRAVASDGKLGTYGVIKGANTFMALTTPNDPTAIVMAGYEFEKLILYCTSLGLGTVWLGGTFDRKAFGQVAPTADGKIMPAVSPVGYAADRRMLEKVFRSVAGSDNRKSWDELFYTGTFSTPLGERAAEEYATPLEMVRIAPSATNTQPWRILYREGKFYFFGAFRHKDDSKTTTMRYLDMGIAMCHFELAARQLGLKGRFVRDDRPDVEVPDGLTYIATWECQ